MEQLEIFDTVVPPARVAFPSILAHMDHDLPLEACGWLWDDGSITRFINQARSPSRFAVGVTQMADALAAVDPEEKILIAIYHSHPNGSHFPSEYDRVQMREQYRLNVTYPWLIVTPDQELHLWYWDPDIPGVNGFQIHRYSEVLSAV